MIDEQKLWKTAYLWIRYLNYRCIHYEPDRNEVWLFNSKKEHVAIFKYGTFTSQELDFDKNKIIDHDKQLKEHLNHSIRKYDFFIFTDKTFNASSLNITNPVHLFFHPILTGKDLNNINNHSLVKFFITKNDKKSQDDYKKKVLNTNVVEQSMYRFAPITNILIIVNVLIWLMITLFLPHRSDIEIINLGALSHFNVVQGEWYRLITSMFLHLNFEHLIFNMFSLYIFGKLVEAHIGSLKTLAVYLVSGIFGNLISLAILPQGFSVGASGAIFGLLGALVALMIISKKFTHKTLIQLIIAIIIMAVITLLVRNVNIVAHLSGLLGGFIIIYLSFYKKNSKKYFYVLLILSILCLIVSTIKIFLTPDVNIYNEIIQKEMHNGNFTKSKSMIQNTEKHHYNDDETYVLSGLIIATQDSKAEAMDEWERGLREFPNSAALNYQIALANRSLSDNKNAKKFIDKALKSEPNNHNYQNLKKELDDTNANKS
ncbi:rhomboid family intramembrane serine protease [Staphylococcus canis]|uniref:Rhomboid family intramembrane serine protease n=1 Tax=Staphylococcus canis TaxID=2724942 RepID=A0ABS0TB65_9STAP|nr:rhomboid family intramembrane serine protease [Staphylococcus canis]MBI5975652.1 rhomboid family intramembrane serine protease [Staphylococcus canis]